MVSKTPTPGQSFGDLFPEVAKQWHPTLNGDLKPTDVKPGSNERVWWRCDEGQEIGPPPKQDDGPPRLTLLSVAGSSVIQREPEHRGQAAAIRAVMLRDRSGGHSTGRGGGVGSHLNSPVCVVILDVHRCVSATYLHCAEANGTRLSSNRPAHGMNSMSSNWGTSGGQPVSSNSGRPATRAG